MSITLKPNIITAPITIGTKGPKGDAGTTNLSTFENTDLVGNVLTVTHNLNINYVPVFIITNPSGATVMAPPAAISGANAFTVDFGGSIGVGTWTLAYMV